MRPHHPRRQIWKVLQCFLPDTPHVVAPAALQRWLTWRMLTHFTTHA